MIRFAVSLVAGMFSLQAWAANLDSASFHYRFELVRNADESVRMITLKRGNTRYSLKPIMDDLLQDIKLAQSSSISAQGNFDSLMEQMTEDWQEVWTEEQKELARQAFEALGTADADAVFNHEGFKEVLSQFENRLKDHLIGDRVMAHLDDGAYFYSRAVALQLATWGFNLARRFLPNGPILNIANMIIDLAIRNVQSRRLFHQNMLLFYFENFEPSELGMTPEEVSHARSSIYEARLSWMGYGESKQIRATWDTYGNNKFQTAWQKGGHMLGQNAFRYSEIGDHLCFAFQYVTEKGQRKIINLQDTKFMFSSQPANAFYPDSPGKVQTQRRLLRLAQLGLEFVSLPSFIRGPFNSFISSMYVAQEKTEGALFGYFEASGDNRSAMAVVRQSLNPFLHSDFR